MKNFLIKNKTIFSAFIIIIMLFLARSMYSDHNLKKIIGACVLTQVKTTGIEEAKKICENKHK